MIVLPVTYEPIATTTLSTSTSLVTFSTISGNYTDLVLVVNGKWTGSGGSSFGMRFNSDTGTNYSVTRLYGNGTSAISSRTSNNTYDYSGQVNATEFSPNIMSIMNYSNTTTNKTTISRTNNTGSLTGAFVTLWRSTAAITSISIGYFDAAGDWASGSTFTLYGIRAA